MVAEENYGPLQKGSYYKIIDEKKDWVLVKTRGQNVFAPKWVFE